DVCSSDLEELAAQCADQRGGAESPQARVLHDGEDTLAIPATAHAIHAVGQPVLVEAAGQQQAERHAQQYRHRHWPEKGGAPIGQRTERADQGADQREVDRRLVEFVFGVGHPSGNRNTGEELQREQEAIALPTKQGAFVHCAASPLTPASSKEAISLRKPQAACSSGQASTAPLPSPRRRSSCSSGVASRWFSNSG